MRGIALWVRGAAVALAMGKMFTRTLGVLERARILLIAAMWTPGGGLVKCALPGVVWAVACLFNGACGVVGEAWWALVLEVFPVPTALVFPARGGLLCPAFVP
jgi:hypothetical protein